MNTIRERLLKIHEEISEAAVSCGRDPENITIVAVSKTKSSETVKQGIAAGVEILGENYIQEAQKKIDEIGRDTVSWHFIGHLQSNKAKHAVPYFDLIHTVDSLKLAREINKQAGKTGKVQKILIQVNISMELSKSGIEKADTLQLAEEISRLENLSLKGLMCMPPFFDDPENARGYFIKLRELKEKITAQNLPSVDMSHLSMGMSGDFKVAVKEGSTLVRIGTRIFGARN